MREIERSAASVEEAVEAALAELGASEQEVSIEVVEEPKGGFLRLGSHAAVVRVRLKEGEDDARDLEEQGDLAADFLEELVHRMGIAAEVEPVLEGSTMYVDILAEDADDEDMGLLIGHHGQALDSLQELTRIVVGGRLGTRCRVIVDVEEYRRRRRSRLEAKARDVAKRVVRTGQEEALEPMNPYERKIVHNAVAAVGDVESSSTGEDPSRRVVVRPSR